MAGFAFNPPLWPCCFLLKIRKKCVHQPSYFSRSGQQELMLIGLAKKDGVDSQRLRKLENHAQRFHKGQGKDHVPTEARVDSIPSQRHGMDMAKNCIHRLLRIH